MTNQKISQLTEMSTPTDADVQPIVETGTATTKKITWANIKAILKAYFDTVYEPTISTLPASRGGTGATTASGARTNLGLVIGTNVQAWDADLDTWATKTPPSGTVVGDSDSQDLSSKTIVLRAGITTKAPLKLTSGTNLTTPETGAIEFDGSDFYITI
jgi:hypothetical protein